jgi:glycosyltransferase involved in cell wall biosynthesis
VVVDQSAGRATHDALEPLLTDPRIRYFATSSRGVSNARNEGIGLTTAPIIAFTDDDCRPAADWIDRLLAVFRDPTVAVVCGRVSAPAGSAAVGYAAEFEPGRRHHRGRIPPPGRDWGLSANIALRRSLLDRIAPFDPYLGAGAPLRSGAEFDLLFRVWREGLTVVNASEVRVTHLGVRPHGAAARALWAGYGVGVGAALHKHVRLRDPSGVRLYAAWLAHLLRWNARSLATGARPTGIGFTLGYIRGTVRSYRYGVDRRTGWYKPR